MHRKNWPLESGRNLFRSPKPESFFCSPSTIHIYVTKRIKILHHTSQLTKMNPFQRLPNEIIDAVFTTMHPADIWRFQQSAKSSERVLESHLRTQRYALDRLMLFGCREGNNGVIRKAVSLGASVSTIVPPRYKRRESWSILAASRHPHTVALLFDLGARLDINPNKTNKQDLHKFQRWVSPKFLQVCADRGARKQFVDFQDCINQSLIDHLPRYGEREGDAIGKLSMLLELGANSTAWTEEHDTETAISNMIAEMQPRYPAVWGLPTIDLFLSKKPDLNAPSLRLTRRFSEDPSKYPAEDDCPIAVAVKYMAATRTALIMDMLLSAGAKLDLPVHANLQPLLVYAEATEISDGQGYDYLCRHGANFEQIWQPEQPVQNYHSRPIFRLCQIWEQRPLILENGKVGVIKLFIKRGGIKKVAIPFIKDALRPMMSLDHEGVESFIVIGRYHLLMKFVLQDDNLNPDLPHEIDDLLLEIVEESTVETTELGSSLNFSNIVDPVTVALLLEKGAKLDTAVHGSWTTQDVRNDVASKLEEEPYFIACNI